MENLTKSSISFPWALSVFGVKQLVSPLRRQAPDDAAQVSIEAFNAVTEATEQQLNTVFDVTFKVGDSLQRGMVDMVFGMIVLNPFKVAETASETLRETMEALSQRSSTTSEKESETAAV
jgi:hypothetical protein